MSKAWPVSRLDPQAPLGLNARRILRVRIAEYYSWAPLVTDEQAITELHALRISAKRLRYTLELFEEVFGEAGRVAITRVKAIQEELGNLHDTDVRIDLIQDELTMLASEQTIELGRSLAVAPASTHQAIATSALRPPPDDPRRGLVALLGREYSERHEHYLAFINLWNKYQEEGMRGDLVAISSTRVAVVVCSAPG